MPRRRSSNPLALAVLSCLEERPMHPYEMATTLREREKHESIKLNYGSLYSVVDSLQAQGLIHARETVREGRRPERTIYEITDDGRREFVDWLSEMVSTPAKEWPQLEAALSLIGGLAPDDARRHLEKRHARLAIEIAQLEAAEQVGRQMGLPRIFWIEGEYRLAIKRTEADFVAKLCADIANGTLDGIDRWRAFHDGDVHAWDDLLPDA